MTRLKPLTQDEHRQIAELLNRAADDIMAATRIAAAAKGARYTDDGLRVCRALQGKLIDPLRNDWESAGFGWDDPYQNVGYGV